MTRAFSPRSLPLSQLWPWIACLALSLCGFASAQKLRVVAANLSSGNNQSYDGGHGARILQGLDPDVVLIQEFNVGNNSTSELRTFVNTYFGTSFAYYHQGASYNIPNGVISRYPILSSGSWNDPELSDREFAWARIDIPGTKDLWVVSLHVKASSGSANEERRNNSAVALVEYIGDNVPTTDYLVIGGDFNSYSRTEDQFTTLSEVVRTVAPFPADKNGNQNTNAGRSSPYDAVLPDSDLYALQVPVVIGTQTFTNGLVADTRVYTPISEISPALSTDSGATGMQHMAVVRDFQLPAATPPTIATSSPMTGGTVGTAYSQTLTATGGATPYSWTVSSGSVPTGLTLGSGGVLSGTPTTAGTFTFTARITDAAASTATKSFSVTITPALAISTSSLAAGTVGSTYSQSVTATGGTAPYTWTIPTGNAPPGLSLGTGGILSGTPTTPGTFTFTARVADSASATATRQFSVSITPTLVASTTALANGTVGSLYSQTVTATGGTTPYTWTISTGSTPAGLSFNAGGVLSGTPTTAGDFTFTARVADSAGAVASRQFTVTITPMLVITTAGELPTGIAGAGYSEELAASGGTPPYGWSMTSGELPEGITLASGGMISGTPATTGDYEFVVRVEDGTGATAEREFSLTVGAALAISSEATLPAETAGGSYSSGLEATGGNAPYQWQHVSGELPGGLLLDVGGIIAGIPTESGVFTFTARVRDETGTEVEKSFNVTITPALSIQSYALPRGVQGNIYTEQLTAVGGTPPYVWNLTDGELPPGIVLDSSGLMTGAPDDAGEYSFTVEVEDAVGAKVTLMLSIEVGMPLRITDAVLADAIPGTAYAFLMESTGGHGGKVWTVVAGSPPEGISLAGDGTLAGATSSVGSFAFTVQVEDEDGATALAEFSLRVVEPLVTYLESHGLQAGDAMIDSDDDGMSNLVEFVLGGNPLEGDPGIQPSAVLSEVGTHLVYQFNVPAILGSATWKVQYGTDAEHWADAMDGEDGVAIESTPSGESGFTITVRIPATEAVRLVRLAVTGP